MLEMKITIAAPELAAAINNLAAAMSNKPQDDSILKIAATTAQRFIAIDDVAKYIEYLKSTFHFTDEQIKDVCGDYIQGNSPEQTEAPVTTAKAKKSKAPAEPTTPAGGVDSGTAPTTATEKVSLTDVRAVALKLSKAGKQEHLKAAFAKFGGKKLSDVKEEDYAALLMELNSGGAE